MTRRGLFQRANARLQDQVYGLQQKLKDQTDTSVNPEDLKQRLGAFTRALCTGQVSRRTSSDLYRVDQSLGQRTL